MTHNMSHHKLGQGNGNFSLKSTPQMPTGNTFFQNNINYNYNNGPDFNNQKNCGTNVHQSSNNGHSNNELYAANLHMKSQRNNGYNNTNDLHSNGVHQMNFPNNGNFNVGNEYHQQSQGKQHPSHQQQMFMYSNNNSGPQYDHPQMSKYQNGFQNNFGGPSQMNYRGTNQGPHNFNPNKFEYETELYGFNGNNNYIYESAENFYDERGNNGHGFHNGNAMLDNQNYDYQVYDNFYNGKNQGNYNMGQTNNTYDGFQLRNMSQHDMSGYNYGQYDHNINAQMILQNNAVDKVQDRINAKKNMGSKAQLGERSLMPSMNGNL